MSIVPLYKVINLSPEGRALKLAVGYPATADPVDEGAGIAYVVYVEEVLSVVWESGSIVSAVL